MKMKGSNRLGTPEIGNGISHCVYGGPFYVVSVNSNLLCSRFILTPY